MTTIKVCIAAVIAFLLFFGALFFNVGTKEFLYGLLAAALGLGGWGTFLITDLAKAAFWPDPKPAPKPKKKTRRRRH